MAFKAGGNFWRCNMGCGSNCCSFIFLRLDPKQEKDFKRKKSFCVDQNYTDFRWLKYHKDFSLKKTDSGYRIITLEGDVENCIKTNPYTKEVFLYAKSVCSMLDVNSNKCKVYRARPEICKKYKCIYFAKDPAIAWFGIPIVEEKK